MLDSALSFGLVVGCSLFSIAWGVVNVFLVRSLVCSIAQELTYFILID